MPHIDIEPLARDFHFAASYILAASLAPDAPEGILTLLLLLYPYDSWGEAPPGCARISTYYFAAQDAYLKAKEMVHRLKQEGESARLCNEVRLKPLLSHLRDFSQGRNTLHYHKEFGSRFHMQVIGLDAQFPMDKKILWLQAEKRDMCASCRRCFHACPANALTEEGFYRDRCLRQHMLRSTPMPERLRTLMGNRLVGCEICQQVCPYNDHLQETKGTGECFPLHDLLKEDDPAMDRLSEKIGRNMAVANRVLAQACIAAGNSGDMGYLPRLNELCKHPSPAVAEHAQWAVNHLSIRAEEATT